MDSRDACSHLVGAERKRTASKLLVSRADSFPRSPDVLSDICCKHHQTQPRYAQKHRELLFLPHQNDSFSLHDPTLENGHKA